MKLTENSLNTINFIKECGGKVSVPEIAAKFGRTPRQVGGTALDLQKKGLITREKVAGAGEDGKDLSYLVATEAGMNFVPTED